MQMLLSWNIFLCFYGNNGLKRYMPKIILFSFCFPKSFRYFQFLFDLLVLIKQDNWNIELRSNPKSFYHITYILREWY